MIEQITILGLVVGFVCMFSAWSTERHKRADYETDICGMIVRGEIDSRNLRRAMRHKEVRKAFDRRYSIDGTFDMLSDAPKYDNEEVEIFGDNNEF